MDVSRIDLFIFVVTSVALCECNLFPLKDIWVVSGQAMVNNTAADIRGHACWWTFISFQYIPRSRIPDSWDGDICDFYRY